MDLYEKLHRKFCLIGGSFFPFNGKYSAQRREFCNLEVQSGFLEQLSENSENWDVEKLEGEYNGYIDGYLMIRME